MQPRRSGFWGKLDPERIPRNSRKIGARSGYRLKIACNFLGSQFDHLQFRKGIRRNYRRSRDLITSPEEEEEEELESIASSSEEEN